MKPGTDALDKIQAIVRAVLREDVSFFDNEDTLVVERELDQVRILYCSARASTSGDPTRLRLSLHCDASEMWIGDLRVAAPLRSAGRGRQLVRAAESIAREMELRVISVFPVGSSGPFWQKMGYRRHRSTARALSKDVG